MIIDEYQLTNNTSRVAISTLTLAVTKFCKDNNLSSTSVKPIKLKLTSLFLPDNINQYSVDFIYSYLEKRWENSLKCVSPTDAFFLSKDSYCQIYPNDEIYINLF